MQRLLVTASVMLLGLPATGFSGGKEESNIKWKKTVLDAKFRSEGAAIADVNKDGKMDIIAGDVWYEAPAWKMHEIRPPKDMNGKDARNGIDPAIYGQSFCCYPDDFNSDGWQDVIVIPFPGKECYWYENPQNKAGHWKEHLVAESACNETPLYVDLFGDGKKVLVMGFKETQMCWFAPSTAGAPFVRHPISTDKFKDGTQRFSHGLGVGDLNGDGRNDVIITAGWWEQPADAKLSDQPWKFHPAKLGDQCADMYATDVDGDGIADVVSSSAHQRGIWWYQQSAAGDFKKFDILNDFTQTHALHFVDINGDGKKDLVTGKRWWAHGAKGDVDPNAPAVLYWIEIKTKKGSAPEFVPHQIDNDSGIGTQFAIGDVNGDRLPDIAVANKKGVFVIEQVR